MEIFCFFMGILYLYTCNHYLPAVTLLLFYITPRISIPILFFMGVLLAWTHQWMIEPHGMPDNAVLPDAVIVGTIASIPVVSAEKTKFHFQIECINNHPAQGLIQLAWYNKAPELHSGQLWQLSVKLKKPRNYRNPGSSDYVKTLSARHIYWTGYVRSGVNQLIKEHNTTGWLQFREQWGTALTQRSPDKKTAGILEALTLNVTTHISQEQWELFRRTGTTHLFGISGEHIALISGMVFFILRWLWSRSVRCCLFAPAISIASIGGFGVALLYSFMAGFEPPVQRALIGCFFYTLCCIGIQRYTIWQVWRYALFGVLCLEPHAVFMQGFYFSFLAVACLLLTQQRWGLKGIKGNLALQLSCLIGLMPLTLYWYSYGSINGFIANLFAIPLVGFLIVPLALMALAISSFSWSVFLMHPLSWLVALLFKMLLWTEHLAGINIMGSLNSIISVISIMAALLTGIILPVKPFRYFAIIWLLVPFFPYKEAIQHGEALIRVLDVGQGLAVVIKTRDHVMLYDTGDQFFQGSDLGKIVILPFLTDLGIKKVDKIVISHPDKDHLGGLKSIEAEVKVDQLIVNNPSFYHRGFNCHNYPEWEWNGVRFHFFPIHFNFNNKNDNSCILQISSSIGSILLTGDIEKTAEDYLVRTYGDQLASDVLIVPHHGSKTSSSYRFLLETAPQYAIASLGFDNRFHFPHNKTMENMNTLNIPFYRTDECGMVQIKLPAKGALKKPSCFSGNK
ncbi:DNA internalization-related competence protein ComEC/Rec2 [Legionella sp. km535]|uniref:DNA internalization-related competence protein ComEC/Rec2 n=1 Tax=Legionella sp. km535 TaxID=2498107 RepID=UPI000F8CDEC7|nr:DNA internalization-related competence protein ComEC/Rec2 [Legionella sp. km535]RUR18508.1 DNA internalization-related competence protein ComEC/Rec2 [Legionella sp. km535]